MGIVGIVGGKGENDDSEDYTKEVDLLIPDAESTARTPELLTGSASDLSSTTRLVKTICQLTYDARDYALLNSSINTLSKKHGQLKSAVQAMVELTIEWLDEIKQRDGVEKWLELVETLRTITEGKIFLETPRARVTLLLSNTTKNSPTQSLQTASDLLSDLQVETYSSMDARRRQIRVGSRKINEDFLKDPENQELKLRFYDMLIQHALHSSAYLDVAKYYPQNLETPSVKEDESGKGRVYTTSFLAPHDNEQSDMLHRLYNDPALSKLELHYDKVWEDLHTRVIEHNVRVIAEYYTRITSPASPPSSISPLTKPKKSSRGWSCLALLGSDRSTCGVINFRQARSAEDVMNDWSSDMQKLLSLVEKAWMGVNAAQAAVGKTKA
ncbi:hypothetical protein BJ322DRAFT_1102336 [Thelephora terrestris]|uniref:PCI domain-containing protein n=1 Tax=Thelephora terrestris TaxID=56493 RepID=A0A9P6L0P6_9AGAM|nr:hypothetical protein BJ322DRAFT_1102336 [Thelephora terrestris]